MIDEKLAQRKERIEAKKIRADQERREADAFERANNLGHIGKLVLDEIPYFAFFVANND